MDPEAVDRAQELDPAAPDPAALRRRVLLTAVVTSVLFMVAAYVDTAARASSAWMLLAVAVIYVAVVRPMMAPVRAATKLRRRLAYHAFLDRRAEQGGPDHA